MSLIDDSYEYPQKKKKFTFLGIICKSLGARASIYNKKSNYICYIRIILASLIIITNFVVIYGVLIK